MTASFTAIAVVFDMFGEMLRVERRRRKKKEEEEEVGVLVQLTLSRTEREYVCACVVGVSVVQWLNGVTGSMSVCHRFAPLSVVAIEPRWVRRGWHWRLSQFPALGEVAPEGGEGLRKLRKGPCCKVDADKSKKTVKVIKIFLLVTGCAWRGR